MPSRVAPLVIVAAALLGCQEPLADDLLAEFPPPRLASEAPRAASSIRGVVLPGSQAALSAYRGRTKVASWHVEPTGWVEQSDGGRIGAGELSLALGAARLELSPKSRLTGASLESLAEPTLVLRWSAGIPTTESGEALRANLQLNRYRSELPLSFRREAQSRRAGANDDRSQLRSTPIVFSPSDHAWQLWWESEDGSKRGPIDAARLELALSLGTEPRSND